MGKFIDLKKAAAVLLTSVTLMSAAAALPAVDKTPLLSQTAITVEAASVGRFIRFYPLYGRNRNFYKGICKTCKTLCNV